MRAERGLADRAIDRLFAEARAAERAGRLDDAVVALTVVVAELTGRGQLFQYPFEWIARLRRALGELTGAERALVTARAIAERAGHRAGMFRMDVARAGVACAAGELARAHDLLAGLRGDGGALGPVTPARFAAVAAWLAALRLAGRAVAGPRAEAVLTIAELWAEHGWYRSALRLVDRFAGELGEAGPVVRRDQVSLLRIEWLIASGELAAAEAGLAELGPGDELVDAAAAPALDAVRLAVVRGRAALLGGRVATAIAQLDALAAAPVAAPGLFAEAMAMRVAVQVELNLYDAAIATADAAIARLGGRPGVAVVEHARRGALARRRSAIALWELPALGATRAFVAPLASPAAPARFAAAWTVAGNAVLEALERGDLAAASARHADLVRLTRGAESRYIAARVRLLGELIALYRAPSAATVAALLEVAEVMAQLGCRPDAAQATRFAAWAAARLGRAAEHAVLAQRAGAIIDAIAGELDAEARTLYLMNKWTGRDDYAAGRMKGLLADAAGRFRAPRRRALLAAFHDIDQLTHWPIDDAFGDRHARRLVDSATSDRVAGWLAERPRRAARGFELRSALGLWWFPARTLVLHYHVLPDRTYLFRIARRHLDVVILPVGRADLRRASHDAVEQPAALAQLAADLGVAAALARFPGVRQLVIIPHDAIANVPFAALPVGDGAVCDRVAVRQLDRLSRLRRRRVHQPARRLVTVGLSRYAGSGHDDLPGTEPEARAVADALAGGLAQACLGDAASCDAVIARLPGATHLHVAAHGWFDPGRPSESGVILRDGDGYRTLTLHELRRLDLRRLQLATLATCRSAESVGLPGRARICLPTALLDAGARGVIASLWPVEDGPSVAVMTALYRRLGSAPPAVALAAVQAEQRGVGAPTRTWAGLVFYGNE